MTFEEAIITIIDLNEEIKAVKILMDRIEYRHPKGRILFLWWCQEVHHTPYNIRNHLPCVFLQPSRK